MGIGTCCAQGIIASQSCSHVRMHWYVLEYSTPWCDLQGAAAALNRDRYGGFHDRHTHGGHVPNPPRLSGSATYRPQLLSGSTLGQSLKRNESGSRCAEDFTVMRIVVRSSSALANTWERSR